MEGMPRFIVEVGSLHGHSAIQMASVLDKLQMTEAGPRIPQEKGGFLQKQ